MTGHAGSTTSRAATRRVEIDLLLRCCDPAGAATIVETPLEIDWDAVAEAAWRHKVTGLLAARLLPRFDPRSMPRAAAERLAGEMERAGALYRARSLVIAELLEAFASAGVRPMLLKGQSIAERFYDPPFARLGRDIDLLVRPDEQREAAAVLEGLGYQPVNPEHYRDGHFHQPWRARRRAAAGPIEIHWDVVEARDAVRFDLPAWWRRAERRAFPFGEILVPPLAHELAYVAFHALQQGSTTLRDLVDVALLARAVERADVTREAERVAKEAGCDGFLDVAAWLIGRIWGTGRARGPLASRRFPSRLSRALFSPEDLVESGPELRWARKELARWSCLPRDRAGLAVPFRRALAQHRQIATEAEGRRSVVREARVVLVLAASLAHATFLAGARPGTADAS